MKIKLILLSLLTFVLLVGCEIHYDVGDMVEDGDWLVVGQHGSYHMIRDVNTGCIYLQDKYDIGSITAYYDEKGDVAGCGEKADLGGEYAEFK